MKRLMSSTLIAWLQANKNCMKADLFAITLPTGITMYATDGQWDITIPSGTVGWNGGTTTFLAMTYGRWNRGAITSEAGYDLKANTMTLTCVPQPGTAYPGLTIGILNAALNGLFDAATVKVYTAYMTSYGTIPAGGIETKWMGTITKISDVNRVKVEFECADPMYLLDIKVPTRLFQSTCPWGFGDSNCLPSGGAAAYTVSFTAKSGSTQYTLIPVSAFTQATGYFSQGVVKCVTGANAGLSQTVKSHDGSGNINTMGAWLLPVVAGDTFSVIKGCDKSMTVCAGTKTAAGAAISNLIHFGGFPFVPVPITAF